jgi:hypothetical protein
VPLEPAQVRLKNHTWMLMAGVLVVVLTMALATLGQGHSTLGLGAALIVTQAALTGLLISAAYLGAGLGLAWPVVRALDRSTAPGTHAHAADRLWLQLALGAGLMPWISHLLGVAGALSGPIGWWVGWGVVTIGLLLLAVQLVGVFAASPRVPDLPWPVLLATPAVAVLLVAASNPPGWLWMSEAGGFDVLSYHLPLAQEWAAPGARLWPLAHNVYSFLPGSMEAAFLHVAALFGGSLVGGEGFGATSCQFLHASYTLVAGALVGRLTWALLVRVGLAERASIGAGLACACVIATPWSVVTGSLAYNEMAMVALLAGACTAALRADVPPLRRGLLTGLLLGFACGFKPTVLLIGGPTVAALMLLGHGPLRAGAARTLAVLVVGGVLGGLLAFGPPLLRNALASANPIFPAGTGLLGHAWNWSDAQVAQFAAAHGRDGTLTDQLARLIETGPGAGAIDRQPRGALHRQWGLLFPVGIVALGLLLLVRRVHTAALALTVGTIGACLAWALFTHGQSRFLMPLIVNMAAGIGLVTGLLARPAPGMAWRALRPFALLTAACVPLVQVLLLVSIYVREGGGSPAAMLIGGVSARTGEMVWQRRSQVGAERFRELVEQSGPEAMVNLRASAAGAPNQTGVFLLGDATPLYYRVPVLYHTVWDRSPLGDAVRASPDDPAAWTRAIMDARPAGLARDGRVSYVLVNFAELSRYWRTYGFDPDVTATVVRRWLDTLGEPMFEWMPEDETGLALSWRDVAGDDPRTWGGRALFRLSPAAARPANPASPPDPERSKRTDQRVSK